jgi:hypothetical protein
LEAGAADGSLNAAHKTIEAAAMIQRPRLLFVDGLPGSGKSTAAAEIGRRCPDSLVFLETHPNHPLLVGAPDTMGAAFGSIHQDHTTESFAAAALQKLDAFLEEARPDARYAFESHPLQSTVRVLLQLDAREPAVLKFWSDLQDRLEPVEPWLLYFRESDPGQAMEAIFRKRGLEWQSYMVEALSQSPWMKARGLSGVAGLLDMVRHYAAWIDRLVDSWRFPMLALPARPESYEARTNTLIEWVTTRG